MKAQSPKWSPSMTPNLQGHENWGSFKSNLSPKPVKVQHFRPEQATMPKGGCARDFRNPLLQAMLNHWTFLMTSLGGEQLGTQVIRAQRCVRLCLRRSRFRFVDAFLRQGGRQAGGRRGLGAQAFFFWLCSPGECLKGLCEGF